MTHRSVMPDYAAAILRSTCEAATAAIAERGRLDDDEIRSFIGGVADCFDADPSDVLLALGLDDLDETRARPRLGGGHVCCGCGGVCDSGMPCPMAYACRCRTLPLPEADEEQLDLAEPPPGYHLAPVLAGSPAAVAAGVLQADALDLEAPPVGWVWCRPGEAIALAAARAEGGAGKGDLCADEAAAHAAAWADHQLAALPPGFKLRDTPGASGLPYKIVCRWNVREAFWMASMSYDDFGDDGEVLGEIMGRVSRWEWNNGESSDHASTEPEARADAWEFFHEQGAATLHDLLLLVGVWPEDAADEAALAPRLDWIRGWSLLERGLVARWAAASHVHASDHDDVRVPARPACLDLGRPA